MNPSILLLAAQIRAASCDQFRLSAHQRSLRHCCEQVEVEQVSSERNNNSRLNTKRCRFPAPLILSHLLGLADADSCSRSTYGKANNENFTFRLSIPVRRRRCRHQSGRCCCCVWLLPCAKRYRC